MAVELSKMNVLYIELANPMYIVADGVPHQDLRITCSDESTIIDSNNMFYVWPVRRGDLNIIIQNKGGDTLAVKNYRVRSIANPELRYGTLQSGTYSRGVITAQPGIYATLGQYFAFEGVKFQVDSSYVRLLTMESEFICKQKGTALHPVIRKNINEELHSIHVYDAYVSRKNTDDVRSVYPLFIRSRDPIPDFEHYSELSSTSLSATLSLNECISIPHDSIVYIKNGKRHVIHSKPNDKKNIPDKVHLIDGDTLMSIRNGNYRLFSESGYLIEAGEIAKMPDSVRRRSIQGALRDKLGNIVLSPEHEEDTIALELKKAYYPIGLWHFYHENGKPKASGKYKVENIRRDEEACYDGSALVLKVIRTGTWKFYDETGKLILEKEYP